MAGQTAQTAQAAQRARTTHTGRPARRGFTLIELMVVVAIIAVLTALAAPFLLPVIHRQQLMHGGDVVAAFLARARAEAMARHRCVRVTIVGGKLVSEVLNSYDCEDPQTAPKIDGASPLYISLATLPPPKNVTFSFGPAPSEAPAGEPAAQLRFRATGRLWSGDATFTDDDGVIVATHGKLPAGFDTRKTLVESQGLICALRVGESPLADLGAANANNLRCP